MIDDQVLNDTRKRQDRHRCAERDAAQQHRRRPPKSEGGQLRDRLDEARIYTRRQQHRAAADARHEVGETHQQTARKAAAGQHGEGWWMRTGRGQYGVTAIRCPAPTALETLLATKVSAQVLRSMA